MVSAGCANCATFAALNFLKRPGLGAVIIAGMDNKLLELLVCPVTKGPLDFDREHQELLSRSARLAYPVRNGIPILLENEARTLSDEEIEKLAALRPAL